MAPAGFMRNLLILSVLTTSSAVGVLQDPTTPTHFISYVFLVALAFYGAIDLAFYLAWRKTK